jgi:hypothetical protein
MECDENLVLHAHRALGEIGVARTSGFGAPLDAMIVLTPSRAVTSGLLAADGMLR